MALNAKDAPLAHYRMWNTWEVDDSCSVDHIFDWTAAVARAVAGGLKCVVINCHGLYTEVGGRNLGGFGLDIGYEGILRKDTPKFAVLRGLVKVIIITACGAARISGSPDGDGNAFCSEIARNAGCYVFAPTQMQTGSFWVPENYIDAFEGLVVNYDPDGNLIWSDRGANPLGWLTRWVSNAD